MKPYFSLIANHRGLSAVFLLVLGCVLNLPGTSSLPLMDRDEPKFAQATWEMIETDQFTIPYFNQGYRFDKPPLTYWWMRGHYHLLGKTEIGARLHSVVASILTAYVIYLFGSFLVSREAGLFSGIAWLSCFQVLIHSRLSVADMPLLLGVVITMYALARLLLPEKEPRKFGKYYWVLIFGLVFGFLTKGPVAWIIPALSLLLWRWPIGRQPIRWRRIQPVTSLLIATVMVGLWGIRALWLTDGSYWDVGVGEHVVKRGFSAFNGRVNIPVVYYLGTGIVSLLPWSAFLPGAVIVSKEALKRNPARSFLLAWFLAPFCVFALYATQLPHYILPGFPALMLLLFANGKLEKLDSRLRKNWFRFVVGLMLVVALTVVGAGMFKVFPEPMEAINRLILLAGGLVGLIGVCLPLSIVLIQKHKRCWPVLIAVAGIAGVLTHILTLEIRKVHPIILMKETGVFAETDGVKFVAQGFSEPSWVFYEWSGEPWNLTGDLGEAVRFMEGEGKRAGIFLTEEWRIGEKAVLAKFRGEPAPRLRDQREVIEKAFPRSDYKIAEVSGLNIARTSWVKIRFIQPR
ncbi:MAG: glycosyltransferase family 39 protein [Verrucomicrobiales bacterium]|nr:glycosyltransferase family 39 protein [Verrucomicrobiales bacterium]